MLKRTWWPDLALVVLVALLPALFFWRLITPVPADRMHIASGDFTDQYFPLRAFAAQEWVQGRIPLWNPYLYGGQPGLADIQSGSLYPPHVLEALILGWGAPLLADREVGFPVWALEWQVIAHFSLAAVGAYLFARHLARVGGETMRSARLAAVVTSLVFTYGGYLTGFPVQQVTIVEASAWLPWVLWGLSAALWAYTSAGRRRARLWTRAIAPAGWGALAFGMAIMAGHPQTVLYIFYITLAYTGLLIFQGLLSSTEPAVSLSRRMAGPGAIWLGVVLLGAGTAAAQLLPTLEFISRSLRADLSYRQVATGLPLPELVTIIYPGFWGGSPAYVGVATLVLVGLALALGRPRSAIGFWAGMALVSLLVAFGGSTFLYSFFYLAAPGFGAVRQQERVLLIYSFSAAILAGYGAIVLVRPLSRAERLSYALFRRRLSLVAGAALILTIFFVYGSATATARGEEINLFFGVLRHHLFGLLVLGGMLLLLAWRPRRWLRRPWGMGLVALWLAFNLFTVNWRYNLDDAAETPRFSPDRVTRFLQENLPAPADAGDSPSPGRVASAGLLPGGHSAAAVYNLEDLTGNTPLQLARMADFAEDMPAWRYWQLTNTRYVIETRDIADAGLTLVFEDGERKVFAVGDPFPRAWFVSEVEAAGSNDQATARLAADDFDLRRMAVVSTPPAETVAEVTSAAVAMIDFSPLSLQLAVETSGRHLLVVSQVHYPGWQAEIDGRPTELLRVNVVQQGVIVPAGRHTISFIFRPASFRLGGLISIASLVICAAMLLWRGKPAVTSAGRSPVG